MEQRINQSHTNSTSKKWKRLNRLQIVIAEDSAETLTTGPSTVRVLEDGSNTDNRIGAIEIIIPPHTEQTPLHIHNMHDETFLRKVDKLASSDELTLPAV